MRMPGPRRRPLSDRARSVAVYALVGVLLAAAGTVATTAVATTATGTASGAAAGSAAGAGTVGATAPDEVTTTVTLTAQQTRTAVCGEAFVVATVAAADRTAPFPGRLTFWRNGQPAETWDLDSWGTARARLATSCTVGQDVWTARFDGVPGRYAASPVSEPLTLDVVRRAPTLRLRSTATSLAWGEDVTFSVEARSEPRWPAGTVLFSDTVDGGTAVGGTGVGGTTDGGVTTELARVPLDTMSGAATDVRGLEPGRHSVTAQVVESDLTEASPPVAVTVDVRPLRGTFHPVPPTRLYDTRTPWDVCFHDDARDCPTRKAPVAAGTTREVAVTTAARDTFESGVLPPDAAAVALNVTSTAAERSGWLAVHAGDRGVPGASTGNLWPGRDVATMTVAKVGTDGRVAVHSSARTDVVVDAVGYWTDDATGSLVRAVAPTRVLDTRAGDPVDAGDRVVQVTGAAPVPPSATAVVVNLTATQARGVGHVTARAAGSAPVATSALNAVPGVDRSNLAIVSLGADGTIALTAPVAPVHLVADVVGYLAPAIGDTTSPLPPRRLLDTRDDDAAPRAGDVTVPVAGRAGVPDGARAVWLSVTTTQARGSGYVTVWPGGPRPVASAANPVPGQDIAALTLVPVAADGTIAVHRSAATHVVLDVVGFVGEVG